MLGCSRAIVAAGLRQCQKRGGGGATTPSYVYTPYICIQDGTTALELAAWANNGRGHSEVVGVLIAAGMVAGQWQDVNACLGSVISVYVCMCAWVYVGSEGGM
jgi:hypothetical protein